MALVRRSLAVWPMRRLGTFVMRPRLRSPSSTVIAWSSLTLRMRRTVTACVLRVAVTLIARPPRFGRSARREASAFDQRADRRGLELDPFAALDRRRHRHRAVARADQAAHHHAQRFEDPSHLAVAALLQHDAIPMVRCILVAARVFN